MIRSRWLVKFCLAVSTAALAIVSAQSAVADDITVTKAPAIPYSGTSGYNWTGFYAGGHFGVAWGSSNWTATPGISGSTSLFRTIDTFDEAGSFFAGVQAGYNYMLPNRVVIGAEIDASFPSYQNLAGISIGGTSNFTSPALGSLSYSETMLAFGTARARIGYAPGSWLFYATGGFAWTYNQQSLTQLSTGNSESPFLWRLGWAAGAGVETPIAPHWTARLEYLFTDYGSSSYSFSGGLQPISSNFQVQELRAGFSYQFGNDAAPAYAAPLVTKAPAGPDPDNLSFHGQTTFVWQGYPAFRSPYQGVQSLPGGGEGRETVDVTLFAGVRLWQGAELWVDPEIDQGHGLADTHGVAGFPSAEVLQARLHLPLRARRSVISSGRRSISAARPRRWTPTSISSPARRRRTAWC